MPLLESIPLGLGRAFEDMSPVVPAAFLITIPVLFVLNRMRFGLRLRSAGENPEAARTLGVRIAPLRYAGVALSGAFGGFSGAFLAIEINGLYREGQTQGLGFIALAALILGNWSPLKVMVGSLLFGIAQAIPAPIERCSGHLAASRGVHPNASLRRDDRSHRRIRRSSHATCRCGEGIRSRGDNLTPKEAN